MPFTLVAFGKLLSSSITINNSFFIDVTVLLLTKSNIVSLSAVKGKHK
jgi:hypothetical protein